MMAATKARLRRVKPMSAPYTEMAQREIFFAGEGARLPAMIRSKNANRPPDLAAGRACAYHTKQLTSGERDNLYTQCLAFGDGNESIVRLS